MSTRKFTEEDIDEMVFLAKKFNSYRKAALEFGCSYQTVADRCHKRGVHIAGPHEICKKKKQLVIDGHTFYWIDKGYYRGSVNGERLPLQTDVRNAEAERDCDNVQGREPRQLRYR